MDLTGKIALVTGAEGGIGQGICSVLSSKGAHVVFASRRILSTDLLKNPNTFSVKIDITSKKSIKEALAAILEKYHTVDILVNNAGVVAAPGWESRQETSDEDWMVNYEVNLRGVAWVIDVIAEQMKKQRSGKIINIASGAARQPVTHLPPAYGATKEGVINLTKYYALALAPFNITVNAICPGLIWTSMWEKVGGHISFIQNSGIGPSAREIFDQQIKARVPLGRPQTPEDIGYTVAFFASEEAKNITGQTLNVNGGARMD
ncbi:MAG: SDR family oxidoreductase [bacterium]|nr:SDR family oxidoreductase [bacterium]